MVQSLDIRGKTSRFGYTDERTSCEGELFDGNTPRGQASLDSLEPSQSSDLKLLSHGSCSEQGNSISLLVQMSNFSRDNSTTLKNRRSGLQGKVLSGLPEARTESSRENSRLIHDFVFDFFWVTSELCFHRSHVFTGLARGPRVEWAGSIPDFDGRVRENPKRKLERIRRSENTTRSHMSLARCRMSDSNTS